MAQRLLRSLAPVLCLTLSVTAGAAKTGRDATCALPAMEVSDVAGSFGSSRIGVQVRVTETSPTAFSASSNLAASMILTPSSGGVASLGTHRGNDPVAAGPPQVLAVIEIDVDPAGDRPTDIDAAALGKGCSPDAAESEVTVGTAIIGPRP